PDGPLIRLLPGLRIGLERDAKPKIHGERAQLFDEGRLLRHESKISPYEVGISCCQVGGLVVRLRIRMDKTDAFCDEGEKEQCAQHPGPPLRAFPPLSRGL